MDSNSNMGPNMGPQEPMKQPMGPGNGPQGPGNFGQPGDPSMMQNAPQGPQMGPQGPMGPGMGPNGSMGPGMGPMGPQGPMPMQKPPKPPKQPMDPAKKKKIILWSSIAAGVVVLGVVIAVVLVMILKVDYRESYLKAKDMDEKIYDIYYSYDCDDAVSYVDSTYIDGEEYEKYITECKALGDGVGTMVEDLGKTSGVAKNSEIKAQYDKFKAAYDKVLPGAEELAAKLDVYKAWHEYALLVDELSSEDPDEDFTAAANALINSGNDVLKAYGEGWLEKVLNYIHAYNAWYDAKWNDPKYDEYYDAYTRADEEFDDYREENRPDLEEIAPLNFSDASEMYEEWNKLTGLIADNYEKNYNSGSGDCMEIYTQIHCDI
ncbi:MAG: hypothetical protein Q4B65_02325 [Candidatus Saccharibacteria bacterium]|nr:hypothetical protein [Candidatus Saccharibacteria bacterium]